MTFDDDVDSYDPLVAERFALLDRVNPADFQDPGRQGPEPTPLTPRPAGNRPLFQLAAAAALAVVAGGAVLALSGRNAEPDVEATTDDVQVEADTADAAVEEGNERLTVEVPAADGDGTGGAASPGADDGGGDRDTDGDAPAEGSATTVGAIGGADGKGGDGISETTGSTEAPDSSTTATTLPADSSPGEAPTTTAQAGAQTTTTRDLDPGSSWLNPPSPEKMVIVEGQLTEIFTDCQSRLVLNSSGQVESIGPVSCDGGSYIMVDSTRIQTTSGFVAAEDQYGKHPSWMKPGQMVTVKAVTSGRSGEILTLDCVLCGVTLDR